MRLAIDPFMKRLTCFSALVLLAPLTWGAGTPVEKLGPRREVTDTPADLFLSPDAIRKSEALSHFAWGLSLQLQQEAAHRAANREVDGALPSPLAPASPAGGRLLRADPAEADIAKATSGSKGIREELPPYLQHYRDALVRNPESLEMLEFYAGNILRAYDAATLIRDLSALSLDYPAAGGLHLTLAAVLASEGRQAEAMAVLQACISASDWGHASVVRELSRLLWISGRRDEAGALLEEALGHEQLRLDFGMQVAAAQFCYQFLTRKGANLSFWSEWRHERRLRGHLDAAVSRLQALADACAADTTAAKPELMSAVEQIEPRDVMLLGSLLQEKERHEDALKVVQAGRELELDLDTDADFLAVRSLIILKRTADAAKELDGIGCDRLGMAPVETTTTKDDGAEPPPERMRQLRDLLKDADVGERKRLFRDSISLGQLNLELGRGPEAINAYEHALFVQTHDERLRFLLARLYLQSNLPAKALFVLRPVSVPRQHKLLLVSQALHKQNKLDEAARTLATAESAAQAAKDKEFFDCDYYFFCAILLESQGKIDLSLEKARQAHALNPESPMSANFLGYMLADHNRELPEAERLIRQAVDADDKNEAYWDSLAWVQYRRQQFRDAWKSIQKAVKLGGEKPDAVILDHAGDIALAAGHQEEARKYWLAALAAGMEKADAVRTKLRQAGATEADINTPPAQRPAK